MMQSERDEEAFLFNLTYRRHFSITKGLDAVVFWNNGRWGFEVGELIPFDEPFNRDNGCRSYSNRSTYNIGINKEGINLLTISSHNSFTISELEVWALND